ncbi:NIPSNAP family protein [Vibrio sp. C8]
MVTCHVRYVIDPKKIVEFEHYARMWIPLVEQFGGQHHGYFLPSEGANNIALALFSFPSLADYEKYRLESVNDEACQVAFKYAEQTDCVLSYERSFFRPILSRDDQ